MVSLVLVSLIALGLFGFIRFSQESMGLTSKTFLTRNSPKIIKKRIKHDVSRVRKSFNNLGLSINDFEHRINDNSIPIVEKKELINDLILKTVSVVRPEVVNSMRVESVTEPSKVISEVKESSADEFKKKEVIEIIDWLKNMASNLVKLDELNKEELVKQEGDLINEVTNEFVSSLNDKTVKINFSGKIKSVKDELTSHLHEITNNKVRGAWQRFIDKIDESREDVSYINYLKAELRTLKDNIKKFETTREIGEKESKLIQRFLEDISNNKPPFADKSFQKFNDERLINAFINEFNNSEIDVKKLLIWFNTHESKMKGYKKLKIAILNYLIDKSNEPDKKILAGRLRRLN